ncbi:LysM peptidoglycan-binding domain-containing protein [Neobacillus cucumis]|uniref:peptidoglycan endopeptidase n=1 Tax=Neobacillus cucumis TaxID=1740721 RepID=UPI00203FB39B|nr:peptidoglycan endopeptidase [Neobacillus cucumis]MCM3729975.1 LysM peptidoglycan-binding domain-containing protein [Neobacillus cucumis]
MKKKLLAFVTATVFGTSLYSTSALAATVKVKSGDTLSKYAKQYNISVSQIKTANKLSSDRLKVGQSLYIPEKSKVVAKTSTSPSSTVYTVKSGDTLSSIAKKYGITVTQLKSWNDLKSDKLKIGQQLKVNSGNVTVTPAKPAVAKPAVATINKAKLIQDAKAVIGVPYKWGGITPKGFDCSGLIHYVINKQKSASRLTVDGYWKTTKPVSSLSAGDFVYYQTYTKGPSHMGIYVGNGQFIHAGSSKGVEITSMNNSYWKSRYLGARQL